MGRSIRASLCTIRPGGIALVVVLLAAAACGRDASPFPAPTPPDPAARGVERVARRAGPPRVTTDLVDSMGRPVTVGCATCHSLAGLSTPSRPVGQPLQQFHQGLVVDHGVRVGLRCDGCHAGPEYATLRTADGRAVPYAEVTELCRQCHGPQARDFDHGAHGGMQGHWDLAYGDRQRHACTTCHDPHSPAYARVWPARPPGDVRWTAPKDHAPSPPPSNGEPPR